jgi:hypothetical protein
VYRFYDIHSSFDFIICPIYYIIVYILAHNYIIKVIYEKELRKLVRLSFLVKNTLAILFVIFFWYQYGYLMDMGTYFLRAKEIARIINVYDISILDIYFDPEYVTKTTPLYIERIGLDATATMPLLILPLYYLGSGSIFGVIFIINFIVFIASTYLYRVFASIFPEYKRESILSIFLLPSMILWAGSIYKDTLAFIGLSFLMYGLYRFFMLKRYNFVYFILLLLSSYLILITKPHILVIYTFIIIWLLRSYAKRLSPVLKVVFYVIGTGVFVIMMNLASSLVSQSQLDAAKFTDIEKVTSIAKGLNNYYANSDVQGGSQYSIGTFEPTLPGLIKLIPAGYVVTFFRPFLWEFRSPVFVFNVIESFVLLYMCLYLVIKWKLKVFKEIFKNEFWTFCFLYTFVLGSIVGIMSFNFGTLARYKTPVMPFFAFMIFSLYSQAKAAFKLKRQQLKEI